MGRLWKTLIAAGVLVAVGIGAFVLAVDRYHRSGPPAQERRARELAIQPLVQSHATRSRVVQARSIAQILLHGVFQERLAFFAVSYIPATAIKTVIQTIMHTSVNGAKAKLNSKADLTFFLFPAKTITIVVAIAEIKSALNMMPPMSGSRITA